MMTHSYTNTFLRFYCWKNWHSTNWLLLLLFCALVIDHPFIDINKILRWQLQFFWEGSFVYLVVDFGLLLLLKFRLTYIHTHTERHTFVTLQLDFLWVFAQYQNITLCQSLNSIAKCYTTYSIYISKCRIGK